MSSQRIDIKISKAVLSLKYVLLIDCSECVIKPTVLAVIFDLISHCLSTSSFDDMQLE